MTNRQFAFLGIIAAAGLAASLVLQQRNKAAFMRQESDLQQQRAELASLSERQRALSNQVVAASAARSNSAMSELVQLRSEAARLREQLREEGGASARSKPPPVAKDSPAPARTPEYFQKLHEGAGTRTRDAVSLGSVLHLYANEHAGELPEGVDQLQGYMGRAPNPISGTHTFEIIYKGSLNALTNIPLSAIALFRDRGTWTAPSGKAARVYGMADGSARIVEADDEFRSFEAQHVVREKGGTSR